MICRKTFFEFIGVSRKAFLLFWTLLSALLLQAQPELDFTFGRVLHNFDTGRNEVNTTDIKTDASGNVYITGYMRGTADLNPGAGTAIFGVAEKYSVFIAKFNSSGAYQFAKSFSGNNFWMVSTGLAIDASGNIHICGYFRGSANFNPGGSEVILTSNSPNYDDIFFAKYTTNGGFVYAHSLGWLGEDFPRDIAADANGNIWLTGSYQGIIDFDPGPGTFIMNSTVDENNFATTDIFLAKYNSSGEFRYAKSLGDNNNTVTASKVVTDGLGNAFITGSFSGTIDMDPGSGIAQLISGAGDDMYFARYDVNGNYVYAKKIGGTKGGYIAGLAVKNGQVYISGGFEETIDFDPGPGLENRVAANARGDIFFARYDANGNYLFAKNMQGTNNVKENNGLSLGADGSIVITGYFGGSIDFDPGPGIANKISSPNWYDTYFAKYDAEGNYLFAQHFGNVLPRDGGLLTGPAMTLDANDNIHIIRPFEGIIDFDPGAAFVTRRVQNGFQHSFLTKYSSSGLYQYVYQLGGVNTATLDDEGRAVAMDALGNVLIAGTFSGIINIRSGFSSGDNLKSKGFTDIFFGKYNSTNGLVVFAKSIGNQYIDEVTGIAADGAGNVYITGSFQGTVDFDPDDGTANLSSTAGSADAFFAKYSNQGNLIYAKSLGSTGPDAGQGIAVDAAGNVFLTGYYTYTVDFDPGPNTVHLSSVNNSRDIFLARYDVNGNYVYAKTMGGWDTDYPKAIAIDANGHTWITGYFEGSTAADFDPGVTNAYLFSFSSSDIFLARYDINGNYVFAKKMGGLNTENVNGLAVDAAGNAYLTGDFTGTAYFGSNNISALSGPVFLAKYDPAGTNVFAKAIGGSSTTATGKSIVTGCGGSVWITGQFYNFNTADFDPGPATANLKNMSGQPDIFLAKYDSEGDYIYAKNMGGNGSSMGNGVAVAATGQVWITGKFKSLADINPAADTAYMQADNSFDIFLAKYTETITNFKSYVSGNWNNPATWGACLIPANNSPVQVFHQVNITANAGCKTINLMPGANVSVSPGILFSVFGF